MPSRTQYKLEEARFFLSLFKDNWRNVPDVDYFLSAFVSAARSVTWVMRYEFSHNVGWDEWFRAQRPSPQIAALLKKMTDVRNRSIKTTPIKTRTSANLSIPPQECTPEVLEYLHRVPRPSFRLEPIDSTNTNFYILVDGKRIAKAVLKSAEHSLPEFNGQDSYAVCKDYLDALEALVMECHKRFKVRQGTPEDLLAGNTGED